MTDATSTGLYAQMDLAPGTMLAGRFRIESLVGVGGMGVVYRALDTALDIPVAVKLLRPELALRADAFERFRQELLLARQVSSPHVVRIHDIARHEFPGAEARWLISMDLIEGEPLDHRLDRGPLEVDDALAIARQVALGLQAAHARGVVHRDLKPANVLIDGSGAAYITDFGVARSLAGSTRTATSGIVGTPDYLSPEQARGDPVGPRSDLYALGLILHEMLTGERAFPAATAAEALAQRLVRSPPLLTELRRDVPGWVARLVERLLRPQPSHRLPDAAAVVQAIDRRELPRDFRPRALLRPAVLAALLGVVALGGAGWWWTAMRESATAVVAPEPSRPLDRLLVAPLEAARLPDALRIGLDVQLRHALQNESGLALVDTDRTLQALRQLEPATSPAAADLRRTGAASRVLRLRLEPAGRGWQVLGDLAGDGAPRPIAGPMAADAPRALAAWLASDSTRVMLGSRGALRVELPDASTLSTVGAAEIARRDSHYDAALATLRQSMPTDSADVAGWLVFADVAQAVGEREAAMSALERAQRAAAARGAPLQRIVQAERALLEGDGATATRLWRERLAAAPSDTRAELQLARAQGASGDFAAAVKTLEALTVRDAQEARAWFELGKFSILKGNARPAVEDHLVRALVLFKRSRNRYGEAEAVNALGIGYGRLGQTADAEEQFRRAVTLRREVGNQRGVATSLRNLANVLSQRAAFDEAARALEQARVLHVQLGDRPGLAALDNERGLLAEERGDYPASLEAFRLALQGWERASDPHGVAQALNNIGFAHYQLGAYDDAQTYWQRAADTYRSLGDHTGTIRTGQNLGLLDAARGRWDDAGRRQDEALRLATAQQMPEEAAVAHRNLAELALMRGRIGDAMREAAAARRLFDERDDVRGSIDARLLEAQALLAAGAAEQADRALAALRGDLGQASSEQRAIASRLAAERALAAGDRRAASAAVQAAAPLAQASGVRVLQLELDLLRARIGSADAAALDRATAALGNAGLRLEWLEVATAAAMARGDTAAAVAHYREARALLRDAHPPGAARLHATGAEALRASGDRLGADDADRARREAAEALAASIPPPLRAQAVAQQGRTP
ncbi:protein kinase domain-containing protein [Lysobacter humi (ex Lee et al. 2017)]